jgi:CsoR family transcriptional regulator, copper-sensing transcriptional repressor
LYKAGTDDIIRTVIRGIGITEVIMEEENKDLKKDIQIRLRRIEGQVKGIEKMIDNEACCRDVLVQIAAIRAAINKVGGLVLENYARNCISKDSDCDNSDNVEQLVATLLMFLK